MITLLHIKNIALIDECEINLNEGLNILSGETGAGKSIIIDALGFLLGAKADKNLIRHGEKEAFVEGIFENINSNAERILSELGISLDEGKVIIERKLLSDGRCDARINNKIVTLTALKSLTSVLCDICGQHEHQFLLKVSNHLGILDRFGGTNIGILKDKISEELKTYRHYKNLIKNLGSAEELERLEDLINYQIKDIENANLNDIDEDNQIRSKLQILNNSEKISSSIKNFINYADSNENGFIENVSLSLKELSSLEKYDTEYGLFKERIDNVLIELKDIVNEVKSKAEELTYDENQLIKLQKRMDEINLLKKKYGSSISEILSFYEKKSKELFEIKSNKENFEKYKVEYEKSSRRLYDLSLQIDQARKSAATEFEKRIIKEFEELGIKNADFKVEFKVIPEYSENLPYSNDGLDEIEFLISPNAGQPLKGLAKIASGGEMSRIMLAIKNISSDIEDISTIVFDEIDSGISGNIAEIVARKLYRISKGRQVIAITHLSQLAAMADYNYLISKETVSNSTVTKIKNIFGENLIFEIARLSGGLNDNEFSIPHAKQMKENCDNFKKNKIN